MRFFASLATVALAGSAFATVADVVEKRAQLEGRAAASIPSGWKVWSACAEDAGGDLWRASNALSLQRNLYENNNTPTACLRRCQGQGYGFAALRLGTECWCGSQTPRIRAVSEDLCFQECSGDKNSTCGGYQQSQVYVNLAIAGRRPPTQRVARAAPGWTQQFACITDKTVGQVFLEGDRVFELQSNTPFSCTTYCGQRGFNLAGVEYGNECVCGRGYKRQYPPITRPTRECFMACTGDNSLTCGAGQRIQMYRRNGSNVKRDNGTDYFLDPEVIDQTDDVVEDDVSEEK